MHGSVDSLGSELDQALGETIAINRRSYTQSGEVVPDCVVLRYRSRWLRQRGPRRLLPYRLPRRPLDQDGLRWLSASEDREIHMSRLAATANVTPSDLSRIVARLEKQGSLTRSADLADARKTLARLTDAGALIVEETEPAYVAEVRRHVFDHLDQQAIIQLETLAETILMPLRSGCVSVLQPGNSH